MRHDGRSEPGRSSASAGVSRRRLLGISGVVLIAAGCGGNGGDRQHERDGRPSGTDDTEPTPGRTTAGPSGVLGANFNEDPADLRFSELQDLSASWLRGFIPMPEADEGDPATQRAVATLLTASEHGYGTILSLKFPHHARTIPKADSPAMAAELARVDKVLHAAMGKVNILEIGNEPFIASPPAKQDSAINAFYEKISRHIIAYRKKHFDERCGTRLYMGALNHLDNPEWHTGAAERWMSFARNTSEIEGVDIHPHVAYIEASQKYLDYILPRLRDDQKFLVTEFSLVLHWKQHMRDRIPASFAERYNMNPNMPVWELIKNSIQHPFPQAKWNDFLAMSPWYNTRRHYLRNQVQKFRDTGKLAVATYGVVQADAMVQNIGPDKQPWLFNSLFANRTVRQGRDGTPGRNHAWFEDFRALQRKHDRRPVSTGETAT